MQKGKTMDNLINVQVAIRRLKKKLNKDAKGDIASFYNKIIENVITTLSEIPTIDAVPVVRCKNCKYYKEENGFHNIKFMVCTLSISNHPMRKEGDFCSRGERRTDG